MSDEATDFPVMHEMTGGDERMMVSVSLMDAAGTSWQASVYAPEPVDGDEALMARLAVRGLLGAAQMRGDSTYAAVAEEMTRYSGSS